MTNLTDNSSQVLFLTVIKSNGACIIFFGTIKIWKATFVGMGNINSKLREIYFI